MFQTIIVGSCVKFQGGIYIYMTTRMDLFHWMPVGKSLKLDVVVQMFEPAFFEGLLIEM